MSELFLTLNDRENDTQARVCVEYGTINAEPAAGIYGPYGYVKSVSAWIPAFGSIQIHLDAFFAQIVKEAVDDKIWHDEYRPENTSLDRALTALEAALRERNLV